MKEINIVVFMGTPIRLERKIYASFVIAINVLASNCSIFDVKEEPKAYFVTTIAICKGSLNAFAL
jgi:hypothetical protein